jgi:glycine cleavage system T protein (aminomethyltransferase)
MVLAYPNFLCTSITGPSAEGFLEWLTPSSLSSLVPFSSTLSVFLNEQGSIIDDTIICKHSEEKFYVVTNASRRDRDIEWIRSKIGEWNEKHRNSGGIVRLEVLDNWGLVAVQGESVLVLSPFPCCMKC